MTAGPPASLRARLLNISNARHTDFQRTLESFIIERFLYRLGASPAAERCILKGASLLAVWLDHPYRATRDIDLLAFAPNDDAAIRAILAEVCAVPCHEDGVRFDLTNLSVGPIRAEDEYAGSRTNFLAYLGSARIKVQVDFGVGDALTSEAPTVEYPTLLDDLPAPHIRAYARETTVAEKFEAAVTLGKRNSRMKDFHDLYALPGAFAFDGRELRVAIVACFARRGTQWTDETPDALTSAFYDDSAFQARWDGYIKRGQIIDPPPQRFGEIGERIVPFLAPIRASIVSGEPFGARWQRGGPWQ